MEAETITRPVSCLRSDCQKGLITRFDSKGYEYAFLCPNRECRGRNYWIMRDDSNTKKGQEKSPYWNDQPQDGGFTKFCPVLVKKRREKYVEK